jgi:hypothetical protein
MVSYFIGEVSTEITTPSHSTVPEKTTKLRIEPGLVPLLAAAINGFGSSI